MFVTGDPDSPALDDYLAGRPEARCCVVYVDVSKYWSSGFDPQELLPRLLESTDYVRWEPLYENQLSVTCLLKK